MALQVDVEKKYKDFFLKVNLDTKGYSHGILGASGCGKTMTLKIIAGIITPDKGRVALGSKVLFDSTKKINLKPQARKVAYLFQNYALFPHMTVEENIRFPLGRDEYYKVKKLMEKFQLKGLEKRYPRQLSGGQQQRVALARCLIKEPEILILDEPFSALDEHLKEQLQSEVLTALEDYKGEVLFVSHNRDEAYRFCHSLTVLDKGRVVEAGETSGLFDQPKKLTTARLSGCKNISEIRKARNNYIEALDWGITITVDKNCEDNQSHIGLRAHHVEIICVGEACKDMGNLERNYYRGKIFDIRKGLFEYDVMIALGGQPIWCKLDKINGLLNIESSKGLDVVLKIPTDKILFLKGGYDEKD